MDVTVPGLIDAETRELYQITIVVLLSQCYLHWSTTNSVVNLEATLHSTCLPFHLVLLTYAGCKSQHHPFQWLAVLQLPLTLPPQPVSPCLPPRPHPFSSGGVTLPIILVTEQLLLSHSNLSLCSAKLGVYWSDGASGACSTAGASTASTPGQPPMAAG